MVPKRPRMGSNAESVHSHTQSPSDPGSSASSSGYPYMDFSMPSTNNSIASMSGGGHGLSHNSIAGLYTGSHVSSPQSAGAGSSSVFLPQAPFDLGRHQQHAAPTLRNVTFPPQASGQYTHPSSFHRPSQHSPQAQSQSHSSALFIDLLSTTTGAHHPHTTTHAHAQTSAASSHFSPFDWPVHGQQQQHAPQQHENGGSP